MLCRPVLLEPIARLFGSLGYAQDLAKNGRLLDAARELLADHLWFRNLL
jgi:hypothetical protein